MIEFASQVEGVEHLAIVLGAAAVSILLWIGWLAGANSRARMRRAERILHRLPLADTDQSRLLQTVARQLVGCRGTQLVLARHRLHAGKVESNRSLPPSPLKVDSPNALTTLPIAVDDAADEETTVQHCREWLRAHRSGASKAELQACQRKLWAALRPAPGMLPDRLTWIEKVCGELHRENPRLGRSLLYQLAARWRNMVWQSHALSELPARTRESSRERLEALRSKFLQQLKSQLPALCAVAEKEHVDFRLLLVDWCLQLEVHELAEPLISGLPDDVRSRLQTRFDLAQPSAARYGPKFVRAIRELSHD